MALVNQFSQMTNKKGLCYGDGAPSLLMVVMWVGAWGVIPIVRYANICWHISYFAYILVAIGIVQLCVGVVLARKYYKKTTVLFSGSGWQLAIVLAVGLEIIQFILVKPRLNTELGWWEVIYRLVFYIVIIGFTEELWFRGIWFSMVRGKLVKSVVIGGIVFGMIHYVPSRGIGIIIVTSLVGVTFATARYCGASISTLAIVHGLVDLVNNHLFPAELMRFNGTNTLGILVLGTLILIAILVFLRRLGLPSKKQKPV